MESKEFYCYNSNMASAYNIHLQETKDQTSKATDMSQIGELVRFHRKKSKLTQKQLADLSGVGKTVVYDIEKGKQSIQLKTLVQILKTLNMTLSIQSPLMDAYLRE